MPTIPVPSDRNQPIATPSALAFTRSGTIGFEVYLAAVLAEEERLTAVRVKQQQMKGIGR